MEKASKEDCPLHLQMKHFVSWLDREDIPIKERCLYFYKWGNDNWNDLGKLCIECCKTVCKQSEKMRKHWYAEKSQNNEANIL